MTAGSDNALSHTTTSKLPDMRDETDIGLESAAMDLNGSRSAWKCMDFTEDLLADTKTDSGIASSDKFVW